MNENPWLSTPFGPSQTVSRIGRETGGEIAASKRAIPVDQTS